ncbi:hypothetical protein, partial [Streptomyces goshikiensis]|uniref:hypothetical protein n=1 Tax=Streptomyces goshikiensis TaxID=1942 RepID=UPI00367B8D91
MTTGTQRTDGGRRSSGGTARDAEQWNDHYPVGTPVTAYPGIRPEPAAAGWACERIETRTRTRAWTLGCHTPVVMVEGHAACIALTHIDPHPDRGGGGGGGLKKKREASKKKGLKKKKTNKKNKKEEGWGV